MKTENAHIHLDIVGGIAGDMFISAMLDMFDDLIPPVLASVASVLPDEAGQAELFEGLNSGISGKRFRLQAQQVSASSDAKEHTHSHDHDAGHHHDHHHSHHQASDAFHGHKHTTYIYLCELLRNSALSKEVIQVAVDLLTIIAKAEAKIHAKSLDEVHFHELADWDSLMDVVASAVILDALATCTWSTSKLPLGGGLVNTQHGLIPVPAPATTEILIDFEFFDDGIQGERITPTGAAILRYLSDKNVLTVKPQGSLQATGYGLGTKVFPGMPNILRGLAFDCHSDNKEQDTLVVIEFDVDDMTGEELGLSVDLLRKHQGVIDVVVHTVRGKKNRAMESLRIMANCKHYQDVIDYCFIQTTTIGLRYRFETRAILKRELVSDAGQSFKRVSRPNQTDTKKIEHDELISLASLHERRMHKYKTELS
ncbi:LarC family nickel insertion protein [uncultured Paraglaciecola sp.]|uniref:LarC family nickel insertion protein n=1 Tax=uncultured Paraglaciecola sp. TaxID=1765024 RepID=UPI00259886B2|nr:LarC family nickel insertion protein [uncultured Paraglaciecola sp.]